MVQLTKHGAPSLVDDVQADRASPAPLLASSGDGLLVAVGAREDIRSQTTRDIKWRYAQARINCATYVSSTLGWYILLINPMEGDL